MPLNAPNQQHLPLSKEDAHYRIHARSQFNTWTAIVTIYGVFISCLIVFMAWPTWKGEPNSPALTRPQTLHLQPIDSMYVWPADASVDGSQCYSRQAFITRWKFRRRISGAMTCTWENLVMTLRGPGTNSYIVRSDGICELLFFTDFL